MARHTSLCVSAIVLVLAGALGCAPPNAPPDAGTRPPALWFYQYQRSDCAPWDTSLYLDRTGPASTFEFSADAGILGAVVEDPRPDTVPFTDTVRISFALADLPTNIQWTYSDLEGRTGSGIYGARDRGWCKDASVPRYTWDGGAPYHGGEEPLFAASPAGVFALSVRKMPNVGTLVLEQWTGRTTRSVWEKDLVYTFEPQRNLVGKLMGGTHMIGYQCAQTTWPIITLQGTVELWNLTHSDLVETHTVTDLVPPLDAVDSPFYVTHQERFVMGTTNAGGEFQLNMVELQPDCTVRTVPVDLAGTDVSDASEAAVLVTYPHPSMEGASIVIRTKPDANTVTGYAFQVLEVGADHRVSKSCSAEVPILGYASWLPVVARLGQTSNAVWVSSAGDRTAAAWASLTTFPEDGLCAIRTLYLDTPQTYAVRTPVVLDLNGDGLDDVVFPDVLVDTLMGQADGGFVPELRMTMPIPLGLRSTRRGAGDVDLDGKPDLLNDEAVWFWTE
jgi:hypothetical protein